MQFLHPGALYRFDIPDDWLDAAGVSAFLPHGRCYTWLPDPLWPAQAMDVQHVALPPGQRPQLQRTRMVEVLQAMVRNVPLAPLRGARDPASGRIVLSQGVHRLHAALALRYRQVPVAITPHFDL